MLISMNITVISVLFAESYVTTDVETGSGLYYTHDGTGGVYECVLDGLEEDGIASDDDD